MVQKDMVQKDMVQKEIVQEEAKRGRPPKFDREAVVEAAVGAFFEKGYEATTLADLEAATGVDRSTLYNSFGGKRGLYDLSTTSYLDHADIWLFGPMINGVDDGYSAVIEFLDRLRSGLTSPETFPGCLIVNDMASGSAPDVAERYRQQLETSLRVALGRTGMSDPDARAGLLASSVIGVNLVSKMTGNAKEAGRLVDAMTTSVNCWQAESIVAVAPPS